MSQTSDGDGLLIPISEHDNIQGTIDAQIVLVEYGDYQCLSCGEVHKMIQEIQQQIQLCFVFRHFPRIHIHPQAQKAAEAAEAAAAQNKFWQMHNLLFANQSALNNGYLLEYANQIELDLDRFLRDMTNHVHTERVTQNIQSGIQSGVSSTPALFVNEIRYRDAWDIERLITAIAQARNSQSM
ncbi:DsbA family protein [Nostoc sp. FACHB-133]|uniref:DsbA family protein n=1 Tax=Nostoc sp. FACHB-133 TaxID=2692835 RepID=UPI00168811B6|nr:DsbA family protein [Nostoc sp. FACHB-133]MBD2524706.1 DsbA family protein [Nostoc sp. FACHB-133]